MSIDEFGSYEAFLARVDPILESQAWAIAQACMFLYHIAIDPADLAQSARIYLWQYLERRPDTPVNMLLLLGRLRMYGERQRGRSVLRPHPGKRTRVYEQADLREADLVVVADLDPAPMLSDQQELALLYTCLEHARSAQDEEAEHAAILALRRFARAVQNADLYDQAHQWWREWWQRKRNGSAE
jgi:hypothetical protein